MIHLIDSILSERDAMGDDEYHPISQKGSNLTEAGGIGYTVVDSIDTMLIMGLHDEHSRARDWVATKLSFDRDASFNTFEVRLVFCTMELLSLLRRRQLFAFLADFYLHTIYLARIQYTSRKQRNSPIECYQYSIRPAGCHFLSPI